MVAAAFFSLGGTSASGTPGTIDTVAGGNANFGDGSPATGAILNQPLYATVDSAGNLFISDSRNCRVRKVSGGVITTVAGDGSCSNRGDGGPATSAGLNNPADVAVDSAGNLYVADSYNCTVRKVSGGIITTVAGDGVCGYSGDGGSPTSAALNHPIGIAVDLIGNLYIADNGNCRVREVSGAVISTVVGNGACGYGGDGGPATSADLYSPYDVALDASGNLYVADASNCRVRRVSGGIITTAAGNGLCGYFGDGGAATAASLNAPTGVAVDATGNLYIVDALNCRVREVSSGVINTVIGNGTCSDGGDGGPATAAGILTTGVALDNSGHLYIADYFNCRVREVIAGIITTVAGSGSCYSGTRDGDFGPATTSTLDQPRGLALDNAGSLYIVDSYDCRLRKVDTGGAITTILGGGVCYSDGASPLTGGPVLNEPTGLTVDSAGHAYIADTLNCLIRETTGPGAATTIAGTGTCGYSGDGGPATATALNDPQGVAVDGSGDVYIADSRNCRVRQVSGGTISTIAGDGTCGFGGDGGAAVSAQLNDPSAVIVDGAGNLYIADSGNCRVREVSGGTISTVAGNGTCGYGGDGGSATSAQLKNPAGVALDVAGTLFISDTGNCRVRQVSGGTISTIAGDGTCGFGGDGGPATSAQLAAPSGITVDASGNVYVADTQNNRVRVLWAAGAAAPTPTPAPDTPTATPTPTTFIVSGHVYYLSAGVGIPAVSVTMCAVGGSPCYPTVVTASDGSYVIRGVTAGSYTIDAGAQGSLGPISVNGTKPGQNIIYTPGGSISGHVYHDSATPGSEVAGATVRACSTTGSWCLPLSPTFSAGDGSYGISNLPDGTYTLIVYPGAPYYQASAAGVVVAGGGATTQDVVVMQPPTGSISGHVYHDSATPGNELSGVLVYACLVVNSAPTSCSTAATDSGGFYTVGELVDGEYAVRVDPPNPYGIASITADVSGGSATTGEDIIVLPPTPPPPEVSIATDRTTDGVPAINWSTEYGQSASGCASGTATWEIDAEQGGLLSGDLTETPAASGTYVGTIPAVYPLHGPSEMTITIHCPDSSVEAYVFNIYIDPSGFVRDTAGNPIVGATVILYQSDSPDGPFVQVPDGSLLMSPSNRQNPDTTDASGHFGWDVVAGYYKIRASASGCVDPSNPFQSYMDSGVMAIPPPVTDLDLRLDCTNISQDGYPDSLKLALGANPSVYCPIMRGDVDGDGQVTILDLSKVASVFVQTVPPAPARFDQGPPPFDNRITILDLSKMAAVFHQSVTACP